MTRLTKNNLKVSDDNENQKTFLILIFFWGWRYIRWDNPGESLDSTLCFYLEIYFRFNEVDPESIAQLFFWFFSFKRRYNGQQATTGNFGQSCHNLGKAGRISVIFGPKRVIFGQFSSNISLKRLICIELSKFHELCLNFSEKIWILVRLIMAAESNNSIPFKISVRSQFLWGDRND